MRPHVFVEKPKYCLAFKPAVIWVRCANCGKPHHDYLGPLDADPNAAEISFLRQEYLRTAALLSNKAPGKLRRGGGR
jgi:hypothetical protein